MRAGSDLMFIWISDSKYEAAVRWTKTASRWAFSFNDPLGRQGVWVPIDVFLTLGKASA